MPQRIQRERTKGWRMPVGTVTCTRPGPYGNPHTVAQFLAAFVDGRRPDYEDKLHAASQVVTDFNNDLAARYQSDPAELATWLAPLRGKDLACWCKVGSPCHADQLLTLANDPQIMWHRYDALMRCERAWTPAEATEVIDLRAWLTQVGIISSEVIF